MHMMTKRNRDLVSTLPFSFFSSLFFRPSNIIDMERKRRKKDIIKGNKYGESFHSTLKPLWEMRDITTPKTETNNKKHSFPKSRRILFFFPQCTPLHNNTTGRIIPLRFKESDINQGFSIPKSDGLCFVTPASQNIQLIMLSQIFQNASASATVGYWTQSSSKAFSAIKVFHS